LNDYTVHDNARHDNANRDNVKMSPRIVLASSSPRRRELLTLAGYRFDVVPADIDESVVAGEDAIAYVERLAREKAVAVADAIADRHRDAVVVGADTTVALDGAIMAKPVDSADAARMLHLLSGRTHEVHTGVAVVAVVVGAPAGDTTMVSRVVTTAVTFDKLSEADIATYVATGEPMGKAGAYAIQGFGGAYVSAVNGSVANVIGLPLVELRALLRAAGC
jgi:septum formation protein